MQRPLQLAILAGVITLSLSTLAHAQTAPPSGGIAGALGGESGGAPRRPGPRTALPEARAQALRWARQAHAAGRHRLLIVFEGLWSYSSAFTRKVYDYQRDLRRGQAGEPPRLAALSFVSKHLVAPTLGEDPSLELLILPETSENGSHSVAEQVARVWNEVHGAQARLLVIGMSFGGYAALKLCRKLEAVDVPVHELFTLDARTLPGNYDEFITPSNVRAHANYFQKGVMPGYAIDGAVNRRLGGITHGRLPGDPRVLAHWRAIRGD